MLQIKPVIFNNTYNLPNTKSTSKNSVPSCLAKDTVSFSGKDKDLLELSKKEIFEKIDAAMINENFIGEGNEAKVYKIPDTPYVVRIVKNPKKRDKLLDYKKGLSFNISTEDKINHVVAKLGESSAIMKQLEGETCFAYKNKKELCSLPVESYHNLYKQICFAKDNDMIFDCCETNVIYNPKDKSLTAIDFYKMDSDFPELVRPLSCIYSAIGSQIRPDESELRKLAGALINVVLEELKPGVKTAQSVAEIDINALFRNFESDYVKDMPPQYNILKSKLVDLQCLKLKEYLGQDVEAELNGNIKVVKSLVNQVLLKENNSFFNKLKFWQQDLLD